MLTTIPNLLEMCVSQKHPSEALDMVLICVKAVTPPTIKTSPGFVGLGEMNSCSENAIINLLNVNRSYSN